jgi:hypothetical protein
MPDDSRQQQTIHWPVFAPVCLLGTLLVAAALVLSIQYYWTGIWIEFFLGVGITILLGAVLYVIQGSFMTTVRRAADRVIETVETKATALDERIEAQARRINTIGEEVVEARTRRHGRQAAAAAAIADLATYEAISSAIRDARDRAAISSGLFMVPASADITGMHVVITNQLRMNFADGRTGSPFLSLRPWFLDDRQVERVDWWPGEDAVVVFDRLAQNIEKANLSPGLLLDTTVFFEALSSSILLANASQHGTRKRLGGPLVELLNDEWAVTQTGLESLTSDTVVSVNDFPGMAATMSATTRGESPKFDPPAPEDVDPAAWSQLIKVAAMIYRQHPGITLGPLAATS